EVPLFPSLVAVMVALPTSWPVTRPLLVTVATDVLLLTQVTTRPVSVLPAASLVTAESCCMPPTAMVAAGVRATEATGTSVTVAVAVALFPSLVAVMVAEPAATPVTTPTVAWLLAVTVATAALLVDHVTTRQLRGLPLASRGVAVSCTACPTAALTAAGLRLTDATGTGFTVTAALPVLPSLVAVIVTAPAATPVTSPVEETVAVAGALDVQVITRPESTLPAASLGLAASCTVAPTSTSTVAAPVWPSLVAVTVVEPSAIPVTRPVPSTAATVPSLVVHVTVRPESGRPLASFRVTTSCIVPPTYTVAGLGLSVTEATGRFA